MTDGLPNISAAIQRPGDDHRKHYMTPVLRVSLQMVEIMLPLLNTEFGVAIDAPGGGLFISGEISLNAVKVGYDGLHGKPILYTSNNRPEDFTFPDRMPKDSVFCQWFNDDGEGVTEMAKLAAECLNYRSKSC